MEKPTQKRSCKGCKALRSNGECMLGRKVEATGKPLEPCFKPVTTKQYVYELERLVGMLNLKLMIMNDILNDWKEMYRQK